MRDSVDTDGGRVSAATALTPQEQKRRTSAAKSSRQMNSSVGSFKGGKSSKVIRMEAKQDLDTLNSAGIGVKKNLPKTLKPLQESITELSKTNSKLGSGKGTAQMTAKINAVS